MLIPLLRLGRPHFLVGGFLFYGLGAAIAARHGAAIDWHRYALGQLAVTAFQWMTHYANDYFDYDADRANTTPTRWSGGSRVLPDGLVPREAALVAALVLAAAGVVASIDLGAQLATLAAIAGLAWGYSAPPLRFCARGAGEAVTAIVVTGLVPWLGFALQAEDLAGARALVAAVVPLALLQFAMLVAIELPDAAGDTATAKRTLVVRLGAPRAAWLYRIATAAAYGWLLHTMPEVGVIALPVAVWRIVRIERDSHEVIGFFAVALLLATSTAELVLTL
jgi:1,4-dihydroxy-2-naphthoate octaprenyltransferase